MKQAKVEQNLTGIEGRLVSLVSSLEGQTKDLIGYSTGGDSVAYFQATHPVRTKQINLNLINQSDYPVFDIYAEVIDLDEPIDPEKDKFWTRHKVSVPSIYPSNVMVQAYHFDMSSRDLLRLNVFIHTRTKNLIQQFRIAREGERFFYAYKTECEGKVLEQQIQGDFPGLDVANPESVFK